MKKKLIIFLALILIVLLAIGIFKKDNKKPNLTSIKVAEVAHSIFYAPMYVSDALGYFEDENIDAEIILTSGADAVAAAVLSGDVNIGFCGSEQSIYIYNEGAKDYLVNFAGLTKRDGSFLISRKDEDFDIKNLKGKHIIAGREGGMPAMTLAYTLRENGIELNDLNFDTSIAFASMSGAFIGGTGDYVSLFEPTGLQLEKQGYGYVVASLGELGGEVPYTTYMTKKSYLEDNKDVIEGLPNGTYYLIETIAPKGFILNTEKNKFTVDNKTDVLEVKMYNSLIVNVPNTKSSKSIILISIAAVILTIGVGIIMYLKKH